MRHGKCLLLIIAAILLVSYMIPPSTYSPPPEKSADRNFHVYDRQPKWVAYVECDAYTLPYYNHLINWTLSYPHGYGFSQLGLFKTTIVVNDWKAFLEVLPNDCDVLSRDRVNQSNALYMAALRLENITRGTKDYKELEPFFTYAEYSNRPKANWTQVHFVISTPGVELPNKVPFLATWLGVGLLSLLGVVLYFRRSKVVLAGFLILLLLSLIFVGTYIKWEHENSERRAAFNELLHLKTRDVDTGNVISGVNADFKSPADVSWFLGLLKRENSSITSIEWQDYTLQLQLAVPMDRYSAVLSSFKGKGWEVSKPTNESVMPSSYIQRTNETMKVLRKYIGMLPTDERNAAKGYINELNSTLTEELSSQKVADGCITLFASTPETVAHDYGGLSKLLSMVALLVIALVYGVGRKVL